MRRLLFSTSCLVGVFGTVSAYAGTEASTPDAAGIEEIVVVANRTPTPLDKIGESVTVLTLPELQADQEPVISDILARTPGITFDRNGGVGGTTSVSIRGAEGYQTVVLIDGVKLNDPSSPSGGFDFANLLVGDTSRIEILRGPQSTLWGSQAIGGVVNIVTAEPTKSLEGNIQAEGGSFDTVSTNAGLGGKTDRLSWRVAGNYYNTVGISALDPAFGGTTPDSYHNAGATGRFTYDLTPAVQLDERVYYVSARDVFDGFPPPNFELAYDGEYARTSEFVDYSGATFDLFGGHLKNRLAFQYTAIDRSDYDPSQLPQVTFDSTGHNTRFEYQGTWAIAEGYQAVFGAQHERTTITTASPSSFDPTPVPMAAAATIDSGYAQLQAEVLRGLTLTEGARYDEQSVYGGHATFQSAAAWSLNDDTTILRASFGQGFTAPTLYQLFSDFGNPGLRPETSNGWDAGVEQHFLNNRVTASATYFGRVSKNLINFFTCGSGDPLCATRPFGYYANIDRTRVAGVEVQVSATLAPNLVVSGNYTYTDATDDSPGSLTFGDQLPRRPRNTANASLSYIWPFHLTTAVAIRYSGPSYDDAANTTFLHGYTLTDLRASYPLNGHLELYGRIENLFDRHYETAFQYGSPGRAAYGGVRAKF